VLRKVCVAFIAMCGLAAVLAANAFAVERVTILPESTESSPLTMNGVSGERRVEHNGRRFTCRRDRWTTSPPNLLHVTFEDCREALLETEVECTGNGDAAGEILELGPIRNVFALEMVSGTETKLVDALQVEILEYGFTCGSGVIKEEVKVKGCVAATIEPLETLTRTAKFIFSEFSEGVASILEVLPAGATKEVKCTQETSSNGGRFEEAAESNTEEVESFEKGKEHISVLFMD
jgi:hypothetical protein